MEALLGFDLDVWDYVTFVSMSVIVMGGLGAAVFILGLHVRRQQGGSTPAGTILSRQYDADRAGGRAHYQSSGPPRHGVRHLSRGGIAALIADADRYVIGAQGSAATYAGGETGAWAALRKISIRAHSWANWFYPLNL